MSTLELYNRFRTVPEEAKKTIKGGKLNGFTDINPMWRIKKLTEEFGECGFGWYYDEVERWKESCGQEVAVFVKIHLFVKRNDNWSAPIVGIGGSKMVQLFKGGEVIDFSDEAYKMALTDAISIACKAVGMAADVYVANDRTKYDQAQSQPAATPVKVQAQPVQPTQQPKPISIDTLNKYIIGHAEGTLCKSGKTCRQAYIDNYYPNTELLAAFDEAVADYKVNNNIA